MADHTTRTEYGIRWDDGTITGPDPEDRAREVVALFSDATLLTRTVLVGPWEEPAVCADCGAPVELADPDDPTSHIHADGQPGDGHSAWVDARTGDEPGTAPFTPSTTARCPDCGSRSDHDPECPQVTTSGPAPITDLARVEVVDPKAWAAYGEADVRPCIDAGVHRRFQRHPRSVCPLHAPGTPVGE